MVPISPPIRVAILDDHQTILDGYELRISRDIRLQLVCAMHYGKELETFMEDSSTQADILLADLSVPTSSDTPEPYSVLQQLEIIHHHYEDLRIIIASNTVNLNLIKTARTQGVSGYLTKDDIAAFRDIANILYRVYNGDEFYSPAAVKAMSSIMKMDSKDVPTERELEILKFYANDPETTSKEIGRELSISHTTVRNTLSHLYTKLGVSSRTAAIEKARREGWLS